MNKPNRTATFIIFFLMTIACMHAEEITGKVSVQQNEKGKVDKIVLTADNGDKYNIKASGKGTKLAKVADGESVIISGKSKTVKDKEGNEDKWLSVSGYKIFVKGKVEVQKDEKGRKITGISVGGRKLKLAGKAKELAKKEGKNVIAYGEKTLVRSGKEKIEVFAVKSYKMEEEKEDK